MKITDVRPVPVGRYLFITVHTNEGTTGLGESGTWGFLEASQAAIETFKRYLVGQDPLRIEHHWQYLYRSTHFSGSAIMGALSAVDIALQEYPRGEHEPPKSEIVKGAPKLEDGYLIIPDAPGIGVELAEDAQKRHPYRPRSVTTRLHEDGSVIDQ